MSVVVCIPTMCRARPFLLRSVPQYLQMPFVSAVIITDETGEDIAALKEDLPAEVVNNTKLHLVCNPTRLGPFANKRRAVELAPAGSWVALIDSDNFAPAETYFQPWLAAAPHNPNIVYAPGGSTSPLCNGNSISVPLMHNVRLTKSNIKSYMRESSTRRQTFYVLNTGNFIVKREVYLRRLPAEWKKLTTHFEKPKDSAADAAMQAVKMLMTGADIVVLPQMTYEHEIHENSMVVKHGETLSGKQETALIFHLVEKLM